MKRTNFLVKTILILTALFFISCSEGTTDPGTTDPGTTDSPISPPTWILGTWSSAAGSSSYTFTEDDVVLTSADGTSSFKSTFANFLEEKVNNDTLYELTVEIPSSSSSIYRFEKTGDTTLKHTSTVDGASSPTIDFVKQ